jgi:transcriptional regulator GlxA family with amidase domain
MSKKVEILLYDGMNESEFGLIYEILSTAEIVVQQGRPRVRGFTVDTVADRIAAVETSNGIKIYPHKGLAGSVGADILIVPGGPGARRPLIAQTILDWLTRAVGQAEMIAASSTGVYILGRAGLITNRRVTTHYTLLEDLARLYPRTKIESQARVVSDGRNMITCAGGTGCIDMTLEIILRTYGPEVAVRSAHRIEFPYNPPTEKKSSMAVPDLSKPDW